MMKIKYALLNICLVLCLYSAEEKDNSFGFLQIPVSQFLSMIQCSDKNSIFFNWFVELHSQSGYPRVTIGDDKVQLCFYDFNEGFLFRDIYDMWHEEAKNGNIKKNKALLSKIFGLENPRSNQKIASWNVSSSEVEILAGLYSYKHCGEKIDKLSSKMFSSPIKQKSIKYFGFHYVFSQCSHQELNVEHDDVLSVVLREKFCGEGEPVEAYFAIPFFEKLVNGDIEQKSIWQYLIESGFSEIIQNINCINKNGWLSIVGFFSKNVMISNEKIAKIINNLRGIFINKFIKIYVYLSEEDNSCYKIGVLIKSDVV